MMKEQSPAPAANPSSGLDWLTWLAFSTVIVLGGSNAVAVRFSNQDLPPFWGATFRFSATAILFWLVVLIRRIRVPTGRALMGMILFGALSIGVSYALLYWALVYTPASLTMIILSLGPLLTFLLAWAHGQEAFRWRSLIGALVAFAGIFLGVGTEVGTSIPLLRMVAVFLAAISTSEATVLFKSYPRSDPIVVNAVALTVGTFMLGLISVITGEVWSLPSARPAWIAVSYLILGGSFLMFYLYLYVLQRRTASATAYLFLLFPVATIFIAAWLAAETISLRFLIGSAIALVGVWAGTIARPAS